MDKVRFKEECFSCRECCRFSKGERYFAPIFTGEELRKLKSLKLPRFRQHNNSKNISQVMLVKSKLYPKEYTCPFLDEQKHVCRIYSKRPLDCRIWPFIVMRKRKKVFIAYFNKDYCDALSCLKGEPLKSYKERIVKLIMSRKCLDVFRKYPGLIWKYERGPKFIKDITRKF